MTPYGTEPATFRFVAQHLNHCVTAVPRLFSTFTLHVQVATLFHFIKLLRRIRNSTPSPPLPTIMAARHVLNVARI